MAEAATTGRWGAASGIAARLSRHPLAPIAIAFALLVAWQRQPRFFHAEPVIELYRFLDPGFLPRDFFANSLDGYHYQYFFTLLNGALVRMTGVTPEVALSLVAYVTVVATAAAVAWAAWLLNGRSLRAAALTSAFVGVTLFALGGLGPYLPFARPWAFVQPMVVVAIALVGVRRPVAAAAWLGVASLFHPLVGAVMGTLCLAAAWLDRVAADRAHRFPARAFPREIVVAGLIFAAFLAPNIVFAIQSWATFRLPDREFIDITIFYRHPQHYLTDYWLTRQVFDFAFGMLAIGAALCHPQVRTLVTRPVALIAGALLLLMVAGYMLIEIVPTRLGASLMAYRFSINLHYLLVLLAGRFAWVHCRSESAPTERCWAYLTIAAFLGVGGSYAVLAVFAAALLARRVPDRQSTVMIATAIALAAAVGGENLWDDGVGWGHLAAAGLLIVAVEATFRIAARPLAAAAGLALAALLVLGMRDAFLAPERTAAREAPEHDVARAAREKTPADALFVTPPGLELMRTVGRRPLVVGYEFPFLDEFIAGWHERAQTVWGERSLYYQDAIAEYRNMPDARLVAARERYGATHAVLFSRTATAFRAIYDNGTYKIVRLR